MWQVEKNAPLVQKKNVFIWLQYVDIWGQKVGERSLRQQATLSRSLGGKAQCLQALPLYAGLPSSRAVSLIFISFLTVAELGGKLSQGSVEGQWKVHGLPNIAGLFLTSEPPVPSTAQILAEYPRLAATPMKSFLMIPAHAISSFL